MKSAEEESVIIRDLAPLEPKQTAKRSGKRTRPASVRELEEILELECSDIEEPEDDEDDSRDVPLPEKATSRVT